MKLVWVLLLCSCCVTMVLANCRFLAMEHIKGNTSDVCEYQDVTRVWRFQVKSIIHSPPPMCEKCICAKAGMYCCGYGKAKGEIMAVPSHCKLVNDPGSCEYKVVRKDDQSVKC